MRRLVVVLALCLCPWGALAQPNVTGVAPAAQPHLQRGLKHFEAKEYGRALDEFRAAYDLDPQPALLYTIAQTARLGGDCRRAIRFYEAFLRTAPNERQALAARQNIERCEADLRRTPPPEPASQPASGPTPGVTAPPALPPPPPPPRLSWRSNWAGHGLLISGVVVAAAGASLWGVEHAAIHSANGASDYGTFASRRHDAADAETLRMVGIAAASVGAALMVAGILTYALRGRRHAERVSVIPVGAGALVAASW